MKRNITKEEKSYIRGNVETSKYNLIRFGIMSVKAEVFEPSEENNKLRKEFSWKLNFLNPLTYLYMVMLMVIYMAISVLTFAKAIGKSGKSEVLMARDI